MVAFKRNMPAVIALFFVAPLVAEYLLGDLPLKLMGALIVLAPSYGGAAVLIRETSRRTGRGWPAMLILGAAYALIAEGLVTQSLFNHDYLKMHLQLLEHAYIPSLGIGAWWTLLMFNLHTFWSMGVSIALVEALFPADAKMPWLGRSGDSVVALLLVLGMAANFGMGIKQNHFLASQAQLFSAAVLSVLLIVSAFLVPVRKPRVPAGMVQPPWLTGTIGFVLGLGVLYTPSKWGWAAVAALLMMDALFLVFLTFFSLRTGWNVPHVLSIAAGAALAYGVHAFTQKPLVGGLLWMRISNLAFLTALVWLIWLDTRRILRWQTTALAA